MLKGCSRWSAADWLDAGSLDDFAGTEAPGAHADVPGCAIDHDADPLEIGKPPPARQVVGMTHVVAGHRALTTNLTSLCHFATLLACPIGGTVKYHRSAENARNDTVFYRVSRCLFPGVYSVPGYVILSSDLHRSHALFARAPMLDMPPGVPPLAASTRASRSWYTSSARIAHLRPVKQQLCSLTED